MLATTSIHRAPMVEVMAQAPHRRRLFGDPPLHRQDAADRPVDPKIPFGSRVCYMQFTLLLRAAARSKCCWCSRLLTPRGCRRAGAWGGGPGETSRSITAAPNSSPRAQHQCSSKPAMPPAAAASLSAATASAASQPPAHHTISPSSIFFWMSRGSSCSTVQPTAVRRGRGGAGKWSGRGSEWAAAAQSGAAATVAGSFPIHPSLQIQMDRYPSQPPWLALCRAVPCRAYRAVPTVPCRAVPCRARAAVGPSQPSQLPPPPCRARAVQQPPPPTHPPTRHAGAQHLLDRAGKGGGTAAVGHHAGHLVHILNRQVAVVHNVLLLRGQGPGGAAWRRVRGRSAGGASFV